MQTIFQPELNKHETLVKTCNCHAGCTCQGKKETMNTKDILQAIVTLGKAPKDQVEKAISDFDLTAAVKADAMHLTSSEEIKDIYDDNHAIPSREMINTGPAESASGAGAEKMIREYSDIAPQIGTQRDYEKFIRMFGDFMNSQKAQTDILKNQSALLAKLAEIMVKKADDEEDKEDKMDEAEEATEKARTLTNSLLAKADEVIGKAEALSLKLTTTATAKAKKVIQSRIDRLMTDATGFLEKARRGVLFVNDASLTDAFNDVAVKAEADLVEDDDGDDDDDDKKMKKAEEVRQQATGQDEDDNQPAASEAATKAVLDRVEKALAGMEVMHGEVKDIFAAMGTTSRSKTVSMSAMAKSQPAAAMDDDDKLFERMSSKVLSPQETTMCDNLIQLRALVKGGVKSKSDFEVALKKTPDNVKEIFA